MPAGAEFRIHGNSDRSLLGKFDRITDQIHQHLAQPVCISGNQLGYVRGNPAGQLDTFFTGLWQEELCDTFHYPLQVHRLLDKRHFPGFNFAEIQDFIQNIQE
ncbi:hypothetical protein D3C80_1238200 [compost metagenome]